MKGRYLSNPDYNFEKVNRASMACGPLVKWAIAQVRYLQRCTPVHVYYLCSLKGYAIIEIILWHLIILDRICGHVEES